MSIRFLRVFGRIILVGAIALQVALLGVSRTMAEEPLVHGPPKLRVASARFGVAPEPGPMLNTSSGHAVTEVRGPIETTVTLLDDGAQRVCLIANDFGGTNHNVSRLFRRVIGKELGIPPSHVVIFSSHNHSSFMLVRNGTNPYGMPPYDPSEAELLPIGQEYLSQLCQTARALVERLEPVTVWWAVGQEDRITYHRKGRRANGTSFFMREEDRILQGTDYRGDIDTQAPVVVFKNAAGKPVAAWAQFTGHPVTSYHPEKPVVFGDWPQVACDHLAKQLGGENVPVGFLQGCAGDVNSKEMFRGGVRRATEFGEMLGQSYVDALPQLKQSSRDGFDFVPTTADLPLAPLPGKAELIRELAEIDEFIRRGNAGDETALDCVGLNFPSDLTPKYRAWLVERIRPWTEWALAQHESGKANGVPKTMPIELWVLRVGDVGIVGMPCEPFQGIGRQMRSGSKLPLTIPCGYANYSKGYITDGANTGDREYMSSFYRYTAGSGSNPRPPLGKPAGDAIAEKAVQVLNQMAGASDE